MIKKTILLTRNIIFVIFVVLLLSFTMIFISLLFGFELESIHFKNVFIKKAYFYFDGKVNAKIKYIRIDPPQKKEQISQKSTDKGLGLSSEHIDGFKKIIFLSYFVRKIDIDRAIYGDHNASISLVNNKLDFVSKDLNVSVLIGFNEPSVQLEIQKISYNRFDLRLSGDLSFDLLATKYKSQLHIKSDLGHCSVNASGDFDNVEAFLYDCDVHYEKYNAKTNSGRLKYNIGKKALKFSSNVEAMDIRADLDGEFANNILRLHVQDAHTSSIKKLIEILPLDKILKEWIYKRPVAKSYMVDEFRMQMDFNTMHFDMSKFVLKGFLENVKTKFYDSLDPLTSPLVEVNIRNKIVDIQAKNSSYGKHSLDAQTKIDLLSSMLYIDVSTNDSLDKEIFDIARAFGVDIDIVQKDGLASTKLKLAMSLVNDFFNIDVWTKLVNAKLDIYGEEIYAKNLEVLKRGAKADVSARINKGDMSVNFDTNVSLGKNGAKVLLDLHSLRLGDKKMIVKKGFKTKLDINWKNKLRIICADLGAVFVQKKDSFDVKIGNLDVLRKIVPQLQRFSYDNGSLSLIGKNDKQIANIKLFYHDTFLSRKGKPIKNMRIKITNKKNQTNLKLSNLINLIDKPKSTKIYLNDAQIDTKKIIDFFKDDENSSKKVQKKPPSDPFDFMVPKKVQLSAYNTSFRYDKKRIFANWLSVFAYKNIVRLELQYRKTKITAQKDANKLVVIAKKISPRFIKNLLDLEIMGIVGNIGLIVSGDLKQMEFGGSAKIKDITIKEGKAVMNVIALLNAVPALIRFKSPGFTEDGYVIRKGLIDFYYAKDVLFLKTIHLQGDNTDIIGEGNINFKTKKLDLLLNINTIKGLSNIISKIPIVGYLLLDDGSIGTTLKIGGTIDDPKLETNLGEDVVSYPIGVLERIIKLPMGFFEDDEK